MQEPPAATVEADEALASVEVRVITPVFGGGVRSGGPDASHHKLPDPVTPVRGASVRGQLRFWWRLACGRDLDSDTLRSREGLLWGAARAERQAEGRGFVSLDVDASKLGAPTEVKVFEMVNRNARALPGKQALAYGAFPLQPARGALNDSPGVLHSFSGSFVLSLRSQRLGEAAREAAAKAWGVEDAKVEATLAAEARAALEAWLCFGGIGGRTRRGFGAVACAQGKAGGVDWRPRAASEVARGLGATLVTRGSHARADDALADGLGRLQRYRQGDGIGRNPGQQPKRPGRSRWPEADAIRRITRRNDSRHPPEHPAGQVFPRAAFGMPIVFHFKDNGDPQDTTLQPAGAARLPSPLVLRPLEAHGKYQAAALVLGGPLPPAARSLELLGGGKALGGKLQGELDATTAPKVKPHDANHDPEHPRSVLFSFLRFFKGN